MEKKVKGKDVVWGGTICFKPIKILKSGNVRVVSVENNEEMDPLFKEHYRENQEFLARKLKNGLHQVTVPGFLISQPPDKFQLDLRFLFEK
jgi:hypothetical protein